jgi:septum site-determining protein MinC
LAALELKGRMASLTRLRLLNPDLAAVRAHLEDLARRMPDAVRGMPVVIEADFVPDLGALRELLRAVGMQPVGVSEGPLAEAARASGLAVLPDVKATGAASDKSVAAKAAPTARRPARIVDVPVRSGQQIYAEGADLVVMAAVSPGAEIIADGCVHAYAPLRGRAIAGARGDETARIFCRKFEAELVAVAGVYAVAEQMQGVRGSPVQAYLEQGKLKIEVMS